MLSPLSTIKKPISCSRLPLTIMTLDDWTLINVIGSDSEKYLQSQVTSDIFRMDKNQHVLTAHCNPQGKMWSTLHLFRRGTGFSFIERRSLRDLQLAELKKYAVFSNVMFIPDDEAVLLGIAGFEARKSLASLFRELPTNKKHMTNDGTTIILWFEYPAERFLLITSLITAKYIITELCDKAQLSNSKQWLALNIEAGIPIIDAPNSGLFIPQAANLQALHHAISFKKGCYIGQEMIARAKFRGINKRAMLYLTGTGTASRIPVARENLEIKIRGEDNWRRTGTVLAAVQLEDDRLVVQAVMNNNVDINSVFRVCNDINTLRIKSLPYSLE